MNRINNPNSTFRVLSFLKLKGQATRREIYNYLAKQSLDTEITCKKDVTHLLQKLQKRQRIKAFRIPQAKRGTPFIYKLINEEKKPIYLPEHFQLEKREQPQEEKGL